MLNKFISLEPTEDLLFFMWGHGYEFDYGTKRNSWERFEKICEMVAGRNDIICCSNKEALKKFEKEV
ncbi:MAG: hypothetical protein K6T94_00170 [Paenibacillus sp.]|nr:hypothetical protein [Paenibacillus sp.]